MPSHRVFYPSKSLGTLSAWNKSTTKQRNASLPYTSPVPVCRRRCRRARPRCSCPLHAPVLNSPLSSQASSHPPRASNAPSNPTQRTKRSVTARLHNSHGHAIVMAICHQYCKMCHQMQIQWDHKGSVSTTIRCVGKCLPVYTLAWRRTRGQINCPVCAIN